VEDGLNVATFQVRILHIGLATTLAKAALVKGHYKVAGLPQFAGGFIDEVTTGQIGGAASAPAVAVEYQRRGLVLGQRRLEYGDGNGGAIKGAQGEVIAQLFQRRTATRDCRVGLADRGRVEGGRIRRQRGQARDGADGKSVGKEP